MADAWAAALRSIVECVEALWNVYVKIEFRCLLLEEVDSLYEKLVCHDI